MLCQRPGTLAQHLASVFCSHWSVNLRHESCDPDRLETPVCHTWGWISLDPSHPVTPDPGGISTKETEDPSSHWSPDVICDRGDPEDQYLWIFCLLDCIENFKIESYNDIALRSFLHIAAISREKKLVAGTMPYFYFEGCQGFFILHSTIDSTVHYTPCLWTVWSTVYAQPRWQISGPTGIRTWYLQVTSSSRYEWAIGAGIAGWRKFIENNIRIFVLACV